MKQKFLCLAYFVVLATNAAAGTIDDEIAKLQPGPAHDAIELGRNLVFDTPRYAPGHVSGGMSCNHCHIDGGTRPGASPWYGITGVLPAYSSRNGRVISLEQRINDCFERSENGTALASDSPEMIGLLAYMSFLSKDVPAGQYGPGRGMGKLATSQTPNPAHGQALYGERCAACHGKSGDGIKNGALYSVPPLWGNASYNAGASMARIGPSAAFIKRNMPAGQEGSLTDQEAIDLASYITAQPRPDFAGKAKDWPKGNRPEDARY